jgi:cyclopropane fatty-acyl-phospholipid synthase-like methyltransferase
VVDYFDGINLDLKLFWTDARTLGIHFGYWDADTRSHREAQANINRVLAERAELKRGERVLDAGCGLGGSAIWLAEQYQARVTGITLSQQQAQQARRSAAQRGVAHLTDFVVLDFLGMALPEATFDVVWAMESVCYAWDKRQFLAEAFRVLRPGGRLVLVDGFRTARPLAAADEDFLQYVAVGWGIPDFVTPDELTTALRHVGFTGVRFDDTTDHVQQAIDRLHKIARWVLPPARILNRLGLMSMIRVRNAETCFMLRELVDRKLGIHGIVLARKMEKSKVQQDFVGAAREA